MFKTKKYIVDDIEKITCPICNVSSDTNNKPMKFLHPKHAKNHGTTLEEILENYPNHPTMTLVEFRLRKERGRNGINTLKSNIKLNKTKIVFCYYKNDNDCPKDEIEVPITSPSSKLICNTCINLGKKNPDGRTSSNAELKRQNTLQEKHGKNITNVRHIPGVNEKIKNTNKEKYGGTGFASEELANKTKDTMMKIYGVNNIMKRKETKDKFKGPLIEKYGIEKTKNILELRKKTVINRYGGYTFASKALSKKVCESMKKKYQCSHPMESKEIKEKVRRSLQNKFFKSLINSDRLKERCIPNFNLEEYDGVKNKKYSWECKKCKQIFEDNIDDGHIPKCNYCYPRLTNSGTSQAEQEVLEFIKQYYPNAKSDRTILNGKEIDIYIEELKLGIEYNGLYWHSEIGGNKDSKYHQEKTLLAKSKGIHLIQIFEDEWLNKQDIVKSILLNKMGKSPNKVFARKCIIKSVENKEAKQFLFDNHLQGGIQCTHIGIYFENQLISMISMGKSRFNKSFDYEILRFCNKLNTSVTGGLSKLIKYFRKEYNPESIITYADARIGEGKGYEKCGFKYKELTSPGYFYLKNNGRESRMKYQKHKLKNLLETFDPTFTEWQNMQLNGFDRIWNCGNYVYELILN